MISACLATIPDRISTLERTIDSLYDQVDRICVWLNGFDEKPAILSRPKITFGVGPDLGDLGKFWWVPYADGIYLSCDDDIIYPPDYARRMCEKLEEKPGAIWGVLGSRFRLPIKSYYEDRTPKIGLRAGLPRPVQVHVLGTGTTAFDTRHVRPDVRAFTTPNMADAWLAVWATQSGVPMWCIDRRAGWMSAMDAPGYQIYADYLATGDDRVQTELVARERWARLRPLVAKNGVVRQMHRRAPGPMELSPQAVSFLEERSDGRVIIELGCGRGTDRLCDIAPVITIEHDPVWARRCTSRAECHVAPLAGDPLWYDAGIVRTALSGIEYQCVVVDGPPGRIGRSGILEHLDLFDDVPFLVDDTDRPADAVIAREIARRRGYEARLHRGSHRRMFATIGW